MVRPAPMAAPKAAPKVAGVPGAGVPHGAIRAGRPIAKPANVTHNPAHRVGNAGLQHNHSAFVFRRGDRAYHRRYYIVEGAWFWYDEPVADGDPAFVSAQDPNVPVCDEQTDECY
jgi:hypothetical protein